MDIVLRDFSGIAPAVNPKVLADNMAQEANNCRLDRGSLESLRGIYTATDGSADRADFTKSIYLHRGSFIYSTDRRSYVGEFMPNDPYQKIFYTGGAYPVVRTGTSEYRLGVPAPDIALSAVVQNPPAADDEDALSRNYVYTIVDGFGFEGPPSPPMTVPVDVLDGEQVDLDMSGFTLAGNYNTTSALRRIYRSNTGDTGSYYQYVGEVALGITTFADTVPDYNLQEQLPSANWTRPPDDNLTDFPDGPLQGLTEMPNGVLAGFIGNTLYFSEPYMPHAWPDEYRISTAAQIIGIAAAQQGLVVCTDERPYLITGTRPEGFVQTELEANQACVSMDSIVDMGDYVIYASFDGLVVVSGIQAVVATKDLMTRDEWAQYQPGTINAFMYEGKYVATYGDIDDKTMFIFDPREQTKAFTTLTGFSVLDSVYDSFSDMYHVLHKPEADKWKSGLWNAGDLLPYTWKSKKFLAPGSVNFAGLRVEADGFPVRVRCWVDGRLVSIINFIDHWERRLPSGFKGREFELELSGYYPVSFLSMFTSMKQGA